MENEAINSVLLDTLKVKEAELTKVESKRDLLLHECNVIRDTIRIIADPDHK